MWLTRASTLQKEGSQVAQQARSALIKNESGMILNPVRQHALLDTAINWVKEEGMNKPDKSALEEFVVRAKANTYTGGGQKSPTSRPSSHDLQYRESPFA